MKTLTDRVRWLVEVHHDGNISNAAKKIGLPQPTVSRIVNGKVTDPRADALRRISEAYGVTVDWLLTGQGDGPRDEVSPVVADVVAISDAARGQYLRWAMALKKLPLDPKIRAILEPLPFVAPQLHIQFDERGKSEREIAKVTRRIQEVGNEFIAMTVITAASNWTALVEGLSGILGADLLAMMLGAQIDSLMLRDTEFIEWLRNRGALPSDLLEQYDAYFAEKVAAATAPSPNGRKGE